MRGQMPSGHPPVPSSLKRTTAQVPSDEPVPSRDAFYEALKKINFSDVERDIVDLLTNSQPQWPADFGNYGPFFVRLAWHCSGSYRVFDGRGGCDGGRQRFDPERSWDDNTNLDKARALLWPIKQKYGLGLSWGDLFVLAGTTAIKSMGGPVLGFCGGRIDDPDGSWSAELGPTHKQTEFAPCPVNGKCEPPLGSTTIGLIYLNPEGPMGQPLPEQSAGEVRDAFGRMNMNDSETVALIGGGHAFGKAHGACPKGPGPSPKEDPFNPWPGECGTGKGNDTFTSGFEGSWTSTPTTWSNQYFQNLLQHDWEVFIGPGGKHQWRPKDTDVPLMMLTSDVSLISDPMGQYQPLVKAFAADPDAFSDAFAHAWYKLTTRDMGPVTRCVGDQVPPPQPFQFPLPPPPAHLANFTAVAEDIRGAIYTPQPDILPPDYYDGEAYYGGLFVRLAYQCASTFRVTDYLGGCNGARIRYPPERDWPVNKELDKALLLLQSIKDKYGDSLTWADLIVLAGNVVIEDAGGRPLKFCGGRSDAEDGDGSSFLTPNITGSIDDTIFMFKEMMKLMNMTAREMTALNGGGHSLGKMHPDRSGFTGQWIAQPTFLSNAFFQTLFEEQWEEYTVPESGKVQYKAAGKDLYMLKTDLIFRYDAELAAIAQDFASNNDLFLDEFASAWTKLMNSDRFAPYGNLCDQ